MEDPAQGPGVTPGTAVPPRAGILVVGVGNELFTDEGLGVVAARRVAAACPEGVDVLDGATAGLALLPEIADRDAVLLLDAIVADGAPAGTVLRLAAEEIPMARSVLMSVHQIGVADALNAAEFAGRAPARLAAVGMVPPCLDMGYGLSPAAEAAMDDLLAEAYDVLAGWGVAAPPVGARSSPAAAAGA